MIADDWRFVDVPRSEIQRGLGGTTALKGGVVRPCFSNFTGCAMYPKQRAP